MSSPIPSDYGKLAGVSETQQVRQQTKPSRPIENRQEESAPTARETREAVLSTLESRGNKLEFGSRTAEFSYDNDLDRVVVKIYSSDDSSREVVRQIPPEQFLEFSAKYRELLGLLFDQQA